jgi:type VI secretion system protein ImpF
MGQWSLKERLQPSLLDRLTDLEPANIKESSSQQSMSQTQFKEAVIRDLGWLLNSVAMDVCVNLDKYPEVKSSVLNFGLPDMSGHTSSNVDIRSMESAIRTAIQLFEPRIIRNSLKVKIRSNPDEMSHNSLIFNIAGSVFGQPSPFHVVLKSELDLECGEFQLKESFD